MKIIIEEFTTTHAAYFRNNDNPYSCIDTIEDDLDSLLASLKERPRRRSLDVSGSDIRINELREDGSLKAYLLIIPWDEKDRPALIQRLEQELRTTV
jgi:hypothetical protein